MALKNTFLIVLLNIIISLNVWSTEKNDQFHYQNSVYRDEIKSVQIYRDNSELSNPVVELGSEVQLVLKFDDLAEDSKNYSYTIIHCDADWNESFLRQNEYLTGFQDNPVSDYAMSFNTIIKYVNYQIRIPNEDCQITKSGNYALVVFEDNNRENLVLIRRFFVVEPLTRIEGLVKKATFRKWILKSRSTKSKY